MRFGESSVLYLSLALLEYAFMAHVLTNIETAFKAIGSTPETTPKAANKTAVAYAVAKFLFKLAKKRLDIAEKDALKAGLLGDEKDYTVGASRIVWSARGASFTFSVSLTPGGRILDKDLLYEAVRKRYNDRVAGEILAESEKDRKPSCEYVVSFT